MVTTIGSLSAMRPPIPIPPLTASLSPLLATNVPASEPIIDLRPSLDWRNLLPARLLTASLWGVGLYLAAMPLSRVPANLATAAAFTGLSGLPLVGLVAVRHTRRKQAPCSLKPIGADFLAEASVLHRDPPRQDLATLVGIDEASLFRGRHARICTVLHNSNGELVAIQASQPMMGAKVVSRDAHPVG